MGKGQSLSKIKRKRKRAQKKGAVREKRRRIAEKEITDGASASSSLPSIPTGGSSDQYDVFLSFRGSDTRNAFTDHLYRSLISVGTVPISVFRDDNSLEIGKDFNSEILDAITRSKMSIPIISENYASSKWCLRELVCIMDCHKSTSHTVLPIFYKVLPLDVRYLNGNFGEAFHLRKKRFDKEDIQEGQRALTEVSYLNGWESEKFANGHEGKLVEEVTKTILSKLRCQSQLDVPKHLVGVDDHVNKIRNWVDIPASHARMIGIYGMGGIGKTTLAKVIYNELSNIFVDRSFLPDIRETANNNGIPYLQNLLIKEILRIENAVCKVDDGINLIKSSLKGEKVLILLDDIDHQNQLDALARERDWFTAGSIIIVTTRYKSVLNQSEFEVDYKYELNELDEVHSLLLFERHAFRMGHCPEDFEGISNEILSTMGGLPLAIEVIGSYLYGKVDKKIWQDILKKLRTKPDRDVQKTLKISYDALEPTPKEIFLDIACFLIGKNSKYAVYMWEDCNLFPYLGIEELKLRCLIKIGDCGEFRMHDQLRDLGRSIFCQGQPPERCLKPWLNMQTEGTNRIQGICLHGYYDQPLLDYRPAGHLQAYTNEQFKNLQSLRFLQLRRVALSGDFDKLFSELRWLQWFDDETSLSFTTINLHLPKLVVLQLSGNKFTEHWKGWSLFMVGKRLKVLDLASCEYLRCTPDFSTLIELEILILKKCLRLEQVHPSIGAIKSLVSLDLSGCGRLKELPGEVGKLKELKELILDGVGITKVPMSIGSLRKLEKLSVVGCQSLIEIPSSIGDIYNLKLLDIRCSAIEKLPGAITMLLGLGLGCHLRLKGENPKEISVWSSLKILELACCKNLRCTPDLSALKELEILILKQCDKLEQVPPSIGKLKSLVSLNLSDCGSLKELPEEVGELEKLKELILDSTGIIKIPKSIGCLRKLEKLSAYFCLSLREIPNSIGDLQNLQDLNVSHSAIEKLPGAIGMLKKLQRLSLQFCYRMKGEILSEIDDLSSLEILDIASTRISNLPKSIRNFSSLQRLSLWGCYDFRLLPELPSGLTNLSVSCQNHSLPQLSCLIHLEELDLYKCVQLECIPELPSRLRKICVASCHKLILPKFEVFMYMEELSIKNCGSIERLDLSILNRLKRLHAEDCSSLVEIQSHNNLDFLEGIVIDCCKSIGRLILPKLHCLKQLKANYCDNLVEIQGLDKAELLEVLDISYCESIERLPDLSCFMTLKELNINGCCNLRDVEILERFLLCRSIYITGCQSLEKLPNLSKFENLENFTMRYSLGVTEMPGVEESRSLTHIDITGCKSMEVLPDLSRCDKLQSLVVRDCKKLTQLQGLEKLHLIYLDISGCNSLETIPKLPETDIFRNYERAQDEVPDGNIILL